MRDAELKSYVTRLASIPCFMDAGDGEAKSREIGEEIDAKWGFNGMVRVCEYYRDHVDESRYRALERSWDNIGAWRG